MSLTCPNCGFSNEADSRFCSQCGFQLPSVVSRPPSQLAPPSPKVESSSSPIRSSSKPVVFVSKGSRRHRLFPSRRPSRPCRRQHSGWLMGFVFLGIGFIFVVFLLMPLFLGISYNSAVDWSDFGTSMGHMGSSLGDFFGSLGSSIGDFFGGLGDRLGSFFGGFGDSVGSCFDSGFSFTLLPVFFLSLFPLLFLIIGLVALLRSSRTNRRHSL